jgi:phosphoglycolate phosphatase-like HAD superfamily hydrolase
MPYKIRLACRALSLLMGFALLVLTSSGISAQSDPLPSWNDGATKRSITDFVAQVTAEGSPGFVPIPERIATFDNDGTLWCEQPTYFQGAFVNDSVRKMAPQHPEWKTRQPFKGLIEGDIRAVAGSRARGIAELLAVSYAGMTTERFSANVLEWVETAEHPRFKRRYVELVYQPMIELLAYLRANGFKTFIVSGGGLEFMRPWVEKVYGIPPEQVVGSSGVVEFQTGTDGKPVLMKLAKIEFVADGPGKPVGINRFIGRRPIFAFGNSDGDLQMLQWTAGGPGARFMGIVHHTDAEREYPRSESSTRL